MRTALVLRRVAIVAVLALALVGPGYGTRAVPTQVADVEVLVVVDRTRSMAALDHHDGRHRVMGARQDLLALAESLPGARFALLTWGQEARLEMPFSTDAAMFATALETLRIESIYDGVGSRADRPLEEAREVLERAHEQHPDRQQVLVVVGDGENTDEGEQRSFAPLERYVDAGVVLGYGTEEGARMPRADDLSLEDGYVSDPRTFEDAISRADLDNLRRIADQLDVPFVHRTGPGGMDRIADGFDAQYAMEAAEDQPAAHDLTWVLGLLLLALVLLELRAAWRALWTSHRTLGTRSEQVGP